MSGEDLSTGLCKFCLLLASFFKCQNFVISLLEVQYLQQSLNKVIKCACFVIPFPHLCIMITQPISIYGLEHHSFIHARGALNLCMDVHCSRAVHALHLSVLITRDKKLPWLLPTPGRSGLPTALHWLATGHFEGSTPSCFTILWGLKTSCFKHARSHPYLWHQIRCLRFWQHTCCDIIDWVVARNGTDMKLWPWKKWRSTYYCLFWENIWQAYFFGWDIEFSLLIAFVFKLWS